MEERRHFVRLDTTLSVQYRVMAKAKVVRSITKDIGGGGVCLFLDKPLKPGTQIKVTIALPGRPQPVVFAGEVVWCESYEIIGKDRRERGIEAGVKFVDITPKDREAIQRVVILSLLPHAHARSGWAA